MWNSLPNEVVDADTVNAFNTDMINTGLIK